MNVKFKFEDLAARYPYVGKLKEWTNNHGFVHLIGSHKDFFAHSNEAVGSSAKSGKNLEGQFCVFAVGSTPERADKEFAIEWVLKSDIDGIFDTYLEERKAIIERWTIDELVKAIQAKWYQKIWKGYEIKPLGNDETLLVFLKRHLIGPQNDTVRREIGVRIVMTPVENMPTETRLNASEYVRLCNVAAKSPIRNISKFMDEKGPNLLDEGFFELLEESTLEEVIRIIAQIEWCSNDKATQYLINKRAISIDIESDGDTIFQIGYANGKDCKQLYSISNNSAELDKCLNQLENEAEECWVIGHNIICWDFPILRKKAGDTNYLAKNPLWDTLLISWLLEPWRDTHALTTSEKAHCADKDAKATLTLFAEQFTKLSADFYKKLGGKSLDFNNLLDTLEKSPPLLPASPYKKAPDFLSNCEINGETTKAIIPSHKLKECAWVPGVRYQWPAGYNEPTHYTLCPDKIAKYAKRFPDDIWIKLVSVVLNNAAKNNVQVLVDMIPFWIRVNIEGLINECSIYLLENDRQFHKGDAKWIITTYASMEHLKSVAIKDYLNKTFPVGRKEGILELCCKIRELSSQNVKGLVENYIVDTIQSRTAFNVDSPDKLKSLIGRDYDEGFSYWLEYDPVFERKGSRKPWNLWRAPVGLSAVVSEQVDQPVLPVFSAPIWIDPEDKTRVVSDDIWPSSANRAAYWQDTISRLLSLRENDDATIYVFLVGHEEERESVINTLAALDMNMTPAPNLIPRTALRKLEYLRKKNYRYAIDHIDNCRKWLEAAEFLQCPIRFVIEELPLTQWFMLLNLEKEANIGYNPDLSDDYDSVDISSSPDVDGSAYENQPTTDSVFRNPIAFSIENIQLCVQQFARTWMQGLIGETLKTQKHLPIVIDPRLSLLTDKDLQGLVMAFEVNKASLSDSTIQDLRTYCRIEFNEPDRKEPPEDYEQYRQFLEKHWGHVDFKRETQRPAIEAIIRNDSDVLVRLPTGEGKSVLFHVPALLRGMYSQKLTVVITPLRALMRDQVEGLRKKGFNQSVDFLSGDRTFWEVNEVYQGIIDNRIKLLFVAPERFRNQRFSEALHRRYVNDDGFEYIVLDEAHCVSQWGFEFRPDYLYCVNYIRNNFRQAEGALFPHILMFSATVTNTVRENLQNEIGIDNKTSTLKIKPEDYRHPLQDFITIKTEDVKVKLYGDEDSIDVSARVGFIQKIIEQSDQKKSAVIIFVTRRKDAENIAEKLSISLPQFKIRYFHAGLSAQDRLEIYEELKARKVHVLVCTKAFGMGMDISHIHWCIHLASPQYLEDYLQEVGRTGRGEMARKDAGREEVICTLLYDSSDFSRNHELIQRNEISPPALVSLWNEIQQRKQKLLHTGQSICVLPTDGYQELKGDRLRNALFWLERAKRLTISGYLPDILKITIYKQRLEESSKGDDNEARVSRTLLRLFDIEPYTEKRIYRAPLDKKTQSEEKKKGLLGTIKNFLGFLFVRSTSTPFDNKPVHLNQEVTATPEHESVYKSEIKIGTLWVQSGLPNTDDVYNTLSKLERNDSIEIERNISFTKGNTNDDYSPTMWNWLKEVLNKVFHATDINGRDLFPEEIMQELVLEENQKDKWTEHQFDAGRKRCIRAAVNMCGASGLRITETLSEKNLAYHYLLPEQNLKNIRQLSDILRKMGKELEEKLINLGDTPIGLSQLLQLNKGKVKIREIKSAVRLLSDLGLYRTVQPIIPTNYLLELHTDKLMETATQNTAGTETDEALLTDDQKAFKEIARISRMNKYRSYAMELFAKIPEQNRRQFIDGYFEAGNPDDLEQLIEKTVGKIDDPAISQDLGGILTRVREKAMKDALEILQGGEEPEQFKACSFPYSGKLLVNAGPGAGKTKVLIMRAAHLIHHQGLKPEQVLILAFNRAVVHEIKVRIKQLFDGLGYGAYVRRLKVRTFHAFALEHWDVDDDFDINTIFQQFAQRCSADETFARQVSGGIKSILVDEFQDMDENRFKLLKAIQAASGAGLMVIGDDDQDVLRWNREDNPVPATQYFKQFKDHFNPEEIIFKVNFRCDTKINERAQKLLDIVLKADDRMKSAILLTSHRSAAQGSYKKITNMLEHVRRIARMSVQEKQSYAVLCRTNFQAYKIYRELRNDFPNIRIQGQENLQISRIRAVGAWLDICKKYLDGNEDKIIDGKLFEELWARHKGSSIPEATKQDSQDIDIRFLWDATLDENPNAQLRQHIEFLNDLGTDDYQRILGKKNDIQNFVISTIHKVKGLEFDNVSIISSNAKFPFGNNGENIYLYCADEARLYYVAMTRAKHNLYLELGEREEKWRSQRQNFQGTQSGIYVEGSPAEVFISWPALSNANNGNDLQHYIMNHVKTMDPLSLVPVGRSYGFKHKNRLIGRFTNEVGRNISQLINQDGDLRVYSVYRYPVNEETLVDFPNIIKSCVEQGWLYTVLVSGLIE